MPRVSPRTVAHAVLVALLLQLGCAGGTRDGRPGKHEADALHDAMHQLTMVMVYDIFSPPQASRVYAYASVAAYEAIRHGQPGYRSLAGQLNGLTPVPAPDSTLQYSMPLAGVHALMTVGRALTFSRLRMDSLRIAMDERFRTGGIDAPVYERSIAYGDTVANHILAWAAKDRFIQSRGYAKFTVAPAPGRWMPTPPGYMDAIEPNWGILRPFVMDTGSQFKPVPPAPFDTTVGSAYRAMAQEVIDVSVRLTDEQEEIARFWDCNPYVMNVQGHAMFATKKITPGGHWMEIVSIASRQNDASLVQSAEAYTMTALALADAFISAWDEKYRSNLIRPETTINAFLDEKWMPLLQTPPFPEYPSGHSVISTAAAVALTKVYGSEFAFTDSSEVLFGLPARSFTSFDAAAAEAAISRMYGGIHFRPAIDNGVVMGRQVGTLVNQRITLRDSTVVPKRTVASVPGSLARVGVP